MDLRTRGFTFFWGEVFKEITLKLINADGWKATRMESSQTEWRRESPSQVEDSTCKGSEAWGEPT